MGLGLTVAIGAGSFFNMITGHGFAAAICAGASSLGLSL